MMYKLLADVVVVVHFVFIGFAILGGLLVYRWRWAVVAQIPAAVWAAVIALKHWECPLNVSRGCEGDKNSRDGPAPRRSYASIRVSRLWLGLAELQPHSIAPNRTRLNAVWDAVPRVKVQGPGRGVDVRVS